MGLRQIPVSPQNLPMRQVGTLPNEQQARRFVDYLTTLKIDSQAEEDDDEWLIWALDEEHVADAQAEYREFISNPEDQRYLNVAMEAETLRREKLERQRAAAKNVVEMRGQWKVGKARRAPLTFMIMAAAIVAFFLTNWTMDWTQPTTQFLAFAPPLEVEEAGGDIDAFANIKLGEIWRLVTPIFLHGNIWHIFFNVYMLYYFGTQMENRRGWVRLLLFVVIAAAFSNSAEALANISEWEAQYPTRFGGMSGVNYALFGYIWMQARFLPKSGFHISQLTIIILVGWFFACFTGWVGSIANAAHGAGLFFGIVIGYLPVIFPALEEKI